MDVKDYSAGMVGAAWTDLFATEFAKPYFRELADRLDAMEKQGTVVYPPKEQRFRAFELCHMEDVKVVLLGQDPYHGPGQAMGLSFSVPNGINTPPSLRNIFREIVVDCSVMMSGGTDLTPWASQGVLLLNSILTVEAGKAASHRGIGWEKFTDALISAVNSRCDNVVFMLWGAYARSKAALVDRTRHLVLEAAHPSPLAGGAFFGCRHFSIANDYLSLHGKTPIDWKL